MFTSGSAAPSATMGDTHITHSLAGTGKTHHCAKPTGTQIGGTGMEKERVKPGEAREMEKRIK